MISDLVLQTSAKAHNDNPVANQQIVGIQGMTVDKWKQQRSKDRRRTLFGVNFGSFLATHNSTTGEVNILLPLVLDTTTHYCEFSRNLFHSCCCYIHLPFKSSFLSLSCRTRTAIQVGVML